MPTVLMFKMPFETNHFNRNQKVWVQMSTGAQAAKVCGKYRGKGRYVSAWVSWYNNNKPHPKRPVPMFKKIEIDEDFAKRHVLEIVA